MQARNDATTLPLGDFTTFLTDSTFQHITINLSPSSPHSNISLQIHRLAPHTPTSPYKFIAYLPTLQHLPTNSSPISPHSNISLQIHSLQPTFLHVCAPNL
ncbi:MAG: hypothetical protein K9G11_01525 [Rickettsiaceae bacterium]|nr:hypothetical protein [Rickettsiaceae bacterium]